MKPERRTADGHNIGVLCVLDFEPRPATDREILDLTDLASVVVVDELELRLASSRQAALETALRGQAEDLSRGLQTSLLTTKLPDLDGLELAAEYLPAHHERVGGDFYDAFETLDGYGLLVGDVCGHGPRAAPDPGSHDRQRAHRSSRTARDPPPRSGSTPCRGSG